MVAADQQEAARWFRLAADNEDAGGQASLALMYLQGRGVVKNAAEAAFWFEAAARQGLDWAQYQLGCQYQQGQGVSISLDQAQYWLRLAANQGFMLAQYQLALCLEQTQELASDQTQIFESYLAAAQQGHAPSQYQVGRRYLEALGVEQNSSIGLYWCLQSAKQGDADASAYLSYFYQDGASASFYLDPSYIASQIQAVTPAVVRKSWRAACGQWLKRLRDLDTTEMASPA